MGATRNPIGADGSLPLFREDRHAKATGQLFRGVLSGPHVHSGQSDRARRTSSGSDGNGSDGGRGDTEYASTGGPGKTPLDASKSTADAAALHGTAKPANSRPPRTVRRRLQEIRPHPLARGLLDPRHVAKLRLDIGEHGQRNPISVAPDSDGALVIEDGHHRFAAMTALGLTEIWVVIRPYPSSDPAVVRELTSQLSRRKSPAERTSLLLRAVADLVGTGRLQGLLGNTDASQSRRVTLGRALGVNENLAGKVLTIAETGLAELVDRFASAPLTTARLECLYQLAQTPRDLQRAVLAALGEAILDVAPDDVQILRRGPASSADLSAQARQWEQQVIARLEGEHAGAAGKAAAKVVANVRQFAARLSGPARRLFLQQLIVQLTAEDCTVSGASSVAPATAADRRTGEARMAATNVRTAAP